MKLNSFKQKVLAALLTIVALTVGQSAWADQTWSVTNEGNVFTITRSETTEQATVKYRTVSLSALAGKHFTEATGMLEFAVGESEKTVTVIEAALGDIEAQYRYQTGLFRSYRFEVLNAGGSVVSHCERVIVYGTDYQIELEKFFKNVEVKAFSGPVTVDDVGYGTSPNTYHSINIADYFSATAPQEYFAAIGTQLGMTFDFQAKEIEDGYQYLQILVDKTENYDSGNHDGEVGELHYAQLLAGFGHDPGVVNTDYAYYSFPVGAAADINFGCHDMEWQRYKNTVGRLYTQRIKPGYQYNYQLNTRMLADANLQTLGVRFDASGKHDDRWQVKDFKAHIQAIDNVNPTVIEGDVKISAGPYNAGNTFYLSVPFSEIVYVKYTPTIVTTWGTLTYEAGAGTNVLTFKGEISYSLDTSTPLTITGLSGRVHDMRGNPYKGTASIGVTFPGYNTGGNWGSEAGADGTEALPYIISSTDDLDWLATSVNEKGNDFGPDVSHPDGYFFVLGDNITYPHSNSGTNYTAIGTQDNPFCGTFDGRGYVINGIEIYLPSKSYQALFGHVVGGTVKNVILNGADIWADNYVGGIVGRCDGGTISGCFVIDSKIIGNNHGVIVGNNSATLTGNYYRDCTVSIDPAVPTTNIGYYDDANYPHGFTDSYGAAEPVYTITSGTGISASGASVTYLSVPYFAKNAEVTLSYSGEVDEGNNAIWYNVTSSSGTTDVSSYGLVDGYSFLMPAVDMLASVDVNNFALAFFDDDSARPEGKKNADYIADGGTKKVELHGRRFYQDGEWNTICLPFSLDVEALAASPLANATLMELDVTGTYDTDKQTGFDASTGTLYLYFTPATSITAGTPYIIKWGSPEGEDGYLGTAIDSPRFADVTINTPGPTLVQSADKTLTFKGTYTYLPFAAENQTILFMGEENTLYYPQSGASIGAFRAYFQLADPSEVKAFVLNFGDETPTGLSTLAPTGRVGEGLWYDLQGRKISPSPDPSPVRAGRKLPRGIYINNGKKIYIK
jgi:hypothetical protein